MNTSVLKSNAEYGKIYLVNLDGLRECKFLGTMGDVTGCYYLLDVAGLGESKVKFRPYSDSPDWWRTSMTKGILYETTDDFRKGNPIVEQYGTTANAYNSRFIKPLFPNLSVCGCGGGIYTWVWKDNKATYQAVQGGFTWSWDENGFRYCSQLYTDWYATKEECERANKIEVIRF